MNKNFTTVLLVTCGLTLSACGGSDTPPHAAVETPEPVQPTATEVTIKVIDGYLDNAQICVDRNIDMVCQEYELIETSTTALGEVIISQQDNAYPLIAKVFAGLTIDADSGFARHSYEMIAPAGSTLITPFTTLMVLNGLSEEELAANLGVSSESIFADYVLNDNGDVQLIARSIANTLGSLASTNGQATLNAAIEISNYATNHSINNSSSIMLTQSGNSLVAVPIDATMKSVLTHHQEWTFANLDREMFADESFRIARLTGNTLNLSNDWDNFILEEKVVYNGDGILNEQGSQYQEKFVYVDQNLLVGQASGDASDLNIWMAGLTGVKRNGYLNTSFDPALFRNQQVWYNVFDDGAEISVAKMTFSDNGTVEIAELGANSSSSTPFTLEDTRYGEAGFLNIVLADEDQPLRYESWFTSGEILVVYGENRNVFSLMTQNLDVALAIAN